MAPLAAGEQRARRAARAVGAPTAAPSASAVAVPLAGSEDPGTVMLPHVQALPDQTLPRANDYQQKASDDAVSEAMPFVYKQFDHELQLCSRRIFKIQRNFVIPWNDCGVFAYI